MLNVKDTIEGLIEAVLHIRPFTILMASQIKSLRGLFSNRLPKTSNTCPFSAARAASNLSKSFRKPHPHGYRQQPGFIDSKLLFARYGEFDRNAVQFCWGSMASHSLPLSDHVAGSALSCCIVRNKDLQVFVLHEALDGLSSFFSQD